MDTSPEYIKMSEKAEEIQRNHKPARGDLYKCVCNSCRREDAKIFMIGEEDIDCLTKRDLTNTWAPYAEMVQASEVGGFVAYYIQRTNDYLSYIWLPYQHQLQGMVADIIGRVDPVGAIWKLYQYVGPNRLGMGEQFNSMEQLWLAFVMHEKYDKCWDGSEWQRRDKEKGEPK